MSIHYLLPFLVIIRNPAFLQQPVTAYCIAFRNIEIPGIASLLLGPLVNVMDEFRMIRLEGNYMLSTTIARLFIAQKR